MYILIIIYVTYSVRRTLSYIIYNICLYINLYDSKILKLSNLESLIVITSINDC